MQRRNFIKTAALSAVAISATGFIRFDGKRYVGECETTSDVLGPFYRQNSPVRESLRIKGRVAAFGTITDATIMDALLSKDDGKYPVCVTPNQWGMTFGSVIMTLSGRPFLQITSGPPDESEYLRVDFSEK